MKLFRLVLMATLTLFSMSVTSLGAASGGISQPLPPGAILTSDSNNQLHITFPATQGRYTGESDQTIPGVTWITPFNTEVSTNFQNLEADIADAESGICIVEISQDNGRSWTEAWNARSFPWNEPLNQTSWSYSDDFSAFSAGTHVVLLRAQDCVGNVSPGEILVVRVKK
jgi:hypothetical protein